MCSWHGLEGTLPAKLALVTEQKGSTAAGTQVQQTCGSRSGRRAEGQSMRPVALGSGENVQAGLPAEVLEHVHQSVGTHATRWHQVHCWPKGAPCRTPYAPTASAPATAIAHSTCAPQLVPGQLGLPPTRQVLMLPTTHVWDARAKCRGGRAMQMQSTHLGGAASEECASNLPEGPAVASRCMPPLPPHDHAATRQAGQKGGRHKKGVQERQQAQQDELGSHA